jgi:hypothetical protein
VARGDLGRLGVGEPAMRGEPGGAAVWIARGTGRPCRAQVRVAPECAGQLRGVGGGELGPQRHGLGGIALPVELGGDRRERGERFERTARQLADQRRAAIEQLEPAFVAELDRGVERDVEAAQPAERRGVAPREVCELGPAQRQRGRRLATAVEHQRRGRRDLVGRGGVDQRRAEERCAGELGRARPVAGGGVGEPRQLGRMRVPRRRQLDGEHAIDDLAGAGRLAVAQQPRLGDLDRERDRRGGGERSELEPREQHRIVDRRHRAQSQRQRMTLGELEQAKRLVGLAQCVPAGERGSHIEIGELRVGVLAGEQRRGLARDQLQHVLDQLHRIRNVQAAGVVVGVAHHGLHVGLRGARRCSAADRRQRPLRGGSFRHARTGYRGATKRARYKGLSRDMVF